MYEKDNRDKTKDNLTFPGLIYHSTNSAFQKISGNKKKSFGILMFFLMLLESSNIFQAYHNYHTANEKYIETESDTIKKYTFSKFFREIVNLNENISNEIQLQKSNAWLDNKQNLLKIADNNGDRDYFFEYYEVDGVEYAKRNSEAPIKKKNVELIDIVDGDGEKVSVFREKDNGFSLQLNYKSSDACKAVIKPIKNLKKIEVNTIEVDFNDNNDINKKCSLNAYNDIRYYF
jgi:hypothetical protein